MKALKRIVAIILVCLFLGSTMAWAASEDNVDDLIKEAMKTVNDPSFGQENFTPVEITLSEELYNKIYEPENLLKGNYEAGSVLVGLKKEVTITEGYEALFPELNITLVSRVGKETYETGRILNQIIKIELEEQTRESVVDAIMYLKDSEYVVYAEPDYYLESAFGSSEMGSGVEPRIIPGDINDDGVFNNRDLIMIARIVVGFSTTDYFVIRADANSDGEVNNIDIITVARKIVEIV